MSTNVSNNNTPLVSIIIPMYNAEKYVADTIRSALDQTWANIEIIIINNGSTDSSLAIAEGFNSPQIKIFSKENNGASSARNYGLKEAKGDYIQFLDADDLLMPDKIELQVKQLSGREDTLSICPVIHFTNEQTDLSILKPNGRELSFYNDSDDLFGFLLNLYGANNNGGSMIPVHSWLTPTMLINKAGNWNETLSINDDGEFFCRVVLQAKAIKVVYSTACYYRKHGGNISLSSGKDLKSVESQYNAIRLRGQHLRAFKNGPLVNNVINRALMELLVSTYPAYKTLSNQIIADLKSSGAKIEVPELGGKLLEFIKNTFGWKPARLLQFYYTKAFKR